MIIPDILIRRSLCSLDIELLAVRMRPYYLPMEFKSAIPFAVYIPPSADATVVSVTTHSSVARLQTQHPNAFIAITGDFNHVTLDKTLP